VNTNKTYPSAHSDHRPALGHHITSIYASPPTVATAAEKVPNHPVDRPHRVEPLTVRVQFVVSRPAQVDRAVHAITALVSDDHHVGICVRRNHAASARLEAAEFEHTVLTTPPASPLGSIAKRVLGAVRLGRYTRTFDPDVIVDEPTPAVQAASRLTGTRLVSWNEPTTVNGDVVSPELYGATARYHPEWFSPDESVRECHGVDEPGEYTIALFTAKASPYNAPEGGLSRRTKGHRLGAGRRRERTLWGPNRLRPRQRNRSRS